VLFEYLGKKFEVVEGHADVNVGEVHRKQEGLSHLYMCMLPRYVKEGFVVVVVE